jgi:hypothetical protein
MPAQPDGLARLRRVARRLLWGALACLVLPALALLGTALYEELVPPTDMHLPGLLSVVLVLYVAPVGVVLLVLGLAAAGWAWWLGRDRAPGSADESNDPNRRETR